MKLPVFACSCFFGRGVSFGFSLLLLLLLLGGLKLQVDVVLNASGWLLVVILFVIGVVDTH